MARKSADKLTVEEQRRVERAAAESNPAYVFHDIALVITSLAAFTILFFTGRHRHLGEFDDD